MKCLLVFYFAGFLLADAVSIKKYKLVLEPKEDKFQGTVTLTLSDSDSNQGVELDPFFYDVTKCTYTGNDPPEGKPTDPPEDKPTDPPEDKPTDPPEDKPTDPPEDKPTDPPGTYTLAKDRECTFANNTIKFDGIRTGEDVVLEFWGEYQEDGLSNYTTESGDRLYVADMTAKGHKIIFPCLDKVKAEFEFEGVGEVMSNLENLREKNGDNKISLRDLIFVKGDIVKDDKSISQLTYYRMKNSGTMGQKLKNVMERVAKLDASLKILFTSLSENIRINSRDVIVLSDANLKPDDSGSNYEDIVQELAKKLFQRPGDEKKTFFDIVGPKFAAIKISGEADSLFDGVLKYLQIRAFEEDGFNNSRSLNELVSQNQDIQNSTYFYIKGISVLYSLESVCGDEKFTKGLSNYIKKSNSTAEEVFVGCFENEEKAKEFFKVWTGHPGYPVIHVILNKSGKYDMNQERFLWLGSDQNDRRWVIPIHYKTKEGSNKDIILPATKDNVTVTINSTHFILDRNNKGFYRVNYDAKIWDALIAQLKSNHTAIDPASRMKLIDDVFSFPKSTYNFNHNIPDYVTALKLSEYLRNETDFLALEVAFEALGFLDSALNSSYHGKFRDHMKGILKGIYLKAAKGDIQHTALRNEVMLLACKFGVEECMKDAITTFNKIPSNATELSEHQKTSICSVVRNDSTKWMDSLALLSTVDIGLAEKIRVLGCSRDKTILSLFLTQFVTQKKEQEFTNAVSYAMEYNPDNIKVILDIIKRFEGAITKAFGKKCLQEIVKLTLPKLNSESAVTVKEIAEKLDEPFKKEVNTVCDNVKLWTDKKAKRVEDYFKRSGGSQAKPIALVFLVTTLLPLANHIFHS